MKKVNVQIKSISGKVLFELEKENNTIKETIESANLINANLINANLSYANLINADLSNADLRGADLINANLINADLSNANLRGANLINANLRGANLRGANLRGADLRGANLRGANLRGADLRGADLSNADANESTSMFFSQCPDGEFVGWKKASNKIVKLLILEDSERSSATSLKCRCSKAKVLDIQNLDGSKSDVRFVNSNYDNSFIYEIGEIVEVDDFDNDRWNECSTGIHFFISREVAVNY